jgi:hypothetical protein
MIFNCAERQRPRADTIGRHLQQILEQRNAPAGNGGQIPRPISHVPQVGVPRKCHEDV